MAQEEQSVWWPAVVRFSGRKFDGILDGQRFLYAGGFDAGDGMDVPVVLDSTSSL